MYSSLTTYLHLNWNIYACIICYRITIIPGATIITLINIYINHGLHNAQLTKKPVILSHANNNTCRIKKVCLCFYEVLFGGQSGLLLTTWTLGLILRPSLFLSPKWVCWLNFIFNEYAVRFFSIQFCLK